jgi:hypothetical protein
MVRKPIQKLFRKQWIDGQRCFTDSFGGLLGLPMLGAVSGLSFLLDLLGVFTHRDRLGFGTFGGRLSIGTFFTQKSISEERSTLNFNAGLRNISADFLAKQLSLTRPTILPGSG